MNVDISAIQKDTSIQCRAIIDTATVNDYAERMTEGDKFPPVILYGTKDKCWIGDGWHRELAYEQIGAVAVSAELRPGGRVDALKCALSANALHGLKRSNPDKRRCVEIVLHEFNNISNREIAEMCAVTEHLVRIVIGENEQLRLSRSSKTIGKDGKERPATRGRREKEPEQEEGEEENKERHKRRRPGSYEDWVKLTEYSGDAQSIADQIEILHVDGPHRIPARMLCESLAKRFVELAQKIVR